MIANYTLENSRRDLVNAGYEIPRSEPSLVLTRPAGQLEKIMWVKLVCPYTARAMSVCYCEQHLDLGNGGSYTLCLYNNEFRKMPRRPGIWDRILGRGCVVPWALRDILPAIADSPTHLDGSSVASQSAASHAWDGHHRRG